MFRYQTMRLHKEYPL